MAGAARADRLLMLAAGGRTAERAVVAALERCGNAEVLAAMAVAAGLEPGELPPAKRLVRLARRQSGEARQRRNPVALNEGFTCGQCGETVLPAGRGIQRNHCPSCLYSRHVDVVPGDRAEGCGGLMAPVALERVAADEVILRHRCVVCGEQRRVRAALRSDVQPDSQRALRAISARVEEP
jgi:hypothetical protein